ncbi:uncharacterized protein B0H18DRAFT_1120705 [Fomitopsis serialis]|uniref:uncharacterized protein n=1 Tax=Fomitopsis serialis TaxID=139415 RepID=UPI002007E804|nr:uncharacterized protein B0H18DRAFT_1120705 [Neoantrodia serialis]KAH9922708.1 hypothetical protein B0H18DRAFT_1120705 [Neoantrodia serialis]
MASTATRRLADSVSYVVLSSSTSGQLTIPLIDPVTGKTVHYALVKVDTPPTVASLGLSPRLHMRSVSESGHLHDSHPQTQTARRLDRLAKECMLDVSSNALRMLEEDKEWPSLASSSRSFCVPSSSSRLLAPRVFSSNTFKFDGRPTSYAETPSLYNESQSDESVSYVGTPISHSRSRRQNTVTALGSADTMDSSMLVGLGISGMTKEDGSPFDGLGSLPRTAYTATSTESPMPSPPAYAPASESSWSFLPELSPAAFASDAPEDPVALFWKTATSADFRRYLDNSVSSHLHSAPAGACGSWKVAKKVGTMHALGLAPPSLKCHKKRFSMPRAEEDLFMCETPAMSSLSDRIMTHLEGAKLEEESWMKASSFLDVGTSRRPVSCML